MGKEQEVELKLQVAIPNEWEKICKYIEQLKGKIKTDKIDLAARYFDTVDGDLNKEKIAYRVRKENENWVATIKGGGSANGGLHSRSEWNVAVENGEPDITVFAHTSMDQKLIKRLSTKPLNIIVETVFKRNVVLLTWNRSVIEIALDQGSIFAGGESVPILEVELELKEGNKKDLLHLGSVLAKEFSLIVETKSKLLRGLILGGKIESNKQNKHRGNQTMLAIFQLLESIYDEWINKKDIKIEKYNEQIKIILQGTSLSKQQYQGLTAWISCEQTKKVIKQRVAVAILLLLWSEQD